MKIKKRLDTWIQERHPEFSKMHIQSWIMQGKVKVEGAVVIKPGSVIAEDRLIELDIKEPKYVGRAGFKLEKALDYFNLDVTDFVVLDAGLSTGGFTDCLLQRGVKYVYGVDVGYNQVHEKIREHERVTVMERTNLRELRNVGCLVDLVTLDLSFISIIKVMDAVCAVLKPNGILITLIKPQFEARREDVGRGGIIKNPLIHQEVIERITQGIQAYGFSLVEVIDSPIEGSSGNKEFLAYFNRIPVQETL